MCRFCYRERNRVKTDPDTVRRVIDQVHAESEAHRVVFTGGDPAMPYDNHLEVALRHAREAGLETNLHTNGLLLSDRYAGVRDHVTLHSLAVDGPEADSADWFRGQGYFERFRSNVEFLVADRRRLAFNTFTTATSVRELPRLAEFVTGIADRTEVEYWLISQYRPIGRASAGKAELYGFERDDFVRAMGGVRDAVAPVEIFAQPTRAPEDPYPFRVWVLADGTVTADLGNVAAPRNAVIGDLLADGFEPLVRRAFALREQPQLEGIA
ncbi:radical SAM protein [Streptomyces griseoviridis]|uniref:radical SAM protein n=1 Tax=Streptomyces TaxID=1883 RepID=UPI002472F223|nr:radical SAM protein [Streptomyces sp. MAA16]MDH6703274.1 MoaA/NifB/PqqE/SkfB family radical SAM enzyme [Streptomyces sp. MAA16]